MSVRVMNSLADIVCLEPAKPKGRPPKPEKWSPRQTVGFIVAFNLTAWPLIFYAGGALSKALHL